MQFIIKRVLRYADGIKLLFNTQLDAYKINTDNKVICTYADWINLELFHNIENRNEILFVGFPYKIKGVDILIRAFKAIANHHPNWHLKIMGWYPDIQELIAEIDGHPQIFYHPPVPASQVVEHIGKCGFLVLPSRTEAMGRVLIEAMAAGKARIGSRVDGIPTVINDGVDGLLFESENIAELADKMEQLIVNPELRQRLGDAARDRANVEFTAQEYLRHTVFFYDQVVSKC